MSEEPDPKETAERLSAAREGFSKIVENWDCVNTILQRIEKELRTMPSYSKAAKENEKERNGER
jgi:hypothetical protein